jgi:hypothetical protein
MRAVLSGENMGLPMHDSVAREMELSKCNESVDLPRSSKSQPFQSFDLQPSGLPIP